MRKIGRVRKHLILLLNLVLPGLLINSTLSAQHDATLPCLSSFPLSASTQNSITPSTSNPIFIPVVIHVVWNRPEENISEAQIQSQIDQLNKDFNFKNEDRDLIPFLFEAVAADVGISFCLASQAPDGSSTNGITRTYTTEDQIGSSFIRGKRSVCYRDLGGADAWNPESYLNIWVCNMTSGVAGQASFPLQDTIAEDGIRMSFERFGTTPHIEPPFNLGRTLTHEVGHYLNLKHLWGDCSEDETGICCPNLDADCPCDDGIADTPPQASTFLGKCLTTTNLSCGDALPDMSMNFMNFSDDACMYMFTKGQKTVMLETLYNLRPGLIHHDCGQTVSNNDDHFSTLTAFSIFPNPAVTDQVRIEFISPDPLPLAITFYDYSGKKVSSQKTTGSQIQLPIHQLANGIYWVKAQFKRHVSWKKLIIAR